jgi:CRISPR-associated protein Cas2
MDRDSIPACPTVNRQAMRTTYLVCYDVANDKRLRRTFQTCRNFGDHLQFSVFECDLSPAEKIELETELSIRAKITVPYS